MKIINKRKNYEYDTDYCDNDIFNIAKLIVEFLKNKEKIDNKVLFELLSYFYDIKLDLNDYMEYINSIKDIKYTNIIDIPTNKVVVDRGSEGHGRDFSWWTQNYQLFVKAFSYDFIPSKEEYTMDELYVLYKEGVIIPLYTFGQKTKKSFVNVKDNLCYLTKYNGKCLDENDEYFSFMVEKAIKNIGIKSLIAEIRLFIIKLKLDSVYKRIAYLEDTIETFDELSSYLINIYNENVNGNIIEKTPLEIVISYLENIRYEEKWYEDVTLEQIMNVFSEVDDCDSELCSRIEELVISLRDAELCYEMASNFDWVDKKVMAEIVINDGSPDIIYFFGSEVEGADIKRHKEVILNSKYTDDYILERALKL